MQLYRLTQPRDILVQFVANKIKQQLFESQQSVFDYLCSNYFVIIDEDVPEFIYDDPQTGLVVGLSSENAHSVLVALAKLKLFHYLVKEPCNSTQSRYMQQEETMFIDFFRDIA